MPRKNARPAARKARSKARESAARAILKQRHGGEYAMKGGWLVNLLTGATKFLGTKR